MIDELCSEFADLGSLIRERLNMAELLNHFELLDRPSTLDGEPILQFARKRSAKRNAAAGFSKDRDAFDLLPNVIWVRESLIAEDKTTIRFNADPQANGVATD